MTAKLLPRTLTSYDLLKTLAIVLMVADHVGAFFFPDQLWLRVLGRLCVPMWFFLIGYARSRDIGPVLWGGALVLVAANIITGMSIIPLNILVTMMLTRLLIDPVAANINRSPSAFWAGCAILALLAFPSSLFCEYGTLGVLLALFGWFVRHREELPSEQKNLPLQYMAFCLVFYVALEFFIFAFARAEMMVLCIGSLAVMTGLWHFRPAIYPRLTAALPRPAVALLQLTGRRTAEIYVVHLVLFKFIALFLGDERLGLFDWQFFSVTGA